MSWGKRQADHLLDSLRTQAVRQEAATLGRQVLSHGWESCRGHALTSKVRHAAHATEVGSQLRPKTKSPPERFRLAMTTIPTRTTRKENLMSDPKIRLGGLWKQKSKTGVEYLTGKLGTARLLIFRNEQKSNSNAPDYTMFLVTDDRVPDASRQDSPGDPSY